MRLVLDYIYTLDYQDHSSLSINIDVFIAADFYMIPKLKELTSMKFEQVLFHSLTKATFLDAVNEIYTKTLSKDCTLRPMISRVIMNQHEDLFNSPSFLQMLEDIPELGKDVAISMRSCLTQYENKWRAFRKVQCQFCRHIWADPRPYIPDSTPCPGCQRQLYSLSGHTGWNQCQVE